MSKILPFVSREQREKQKDLERLMELSNQFDYIISKELASGAPVLDVAGVIAHRLGNLLRHAPEELKEYSLQVISQIIAARLDEESSDSHKNSV